jgi:hypothetical protein
LPAAGAADLQLPGRTPSKPDSEVNPMGLSREASDARPFFLEWVIIIIFTAILQRC